MAFGKPETSRNKRMRESFFARQKRQLVKKIRETYGETPSRKLKSVPGKKQHELVRVPPPHAIISKKDRIAEKDLRAELD